MKKAFLWILWVASCLFVSYYNFGWFIIICMWIIANAALLYFLEKTVKNKLVLGSVRGVLILQLIVLGVFASIGLFYTSGWQAMTAYLAVAVIGGATILYDDWRNRNVPKIK